MPETKNTCNKTALKFKGGLFTLTTLQILDTDLDIINQQIKNKVQQAPNFFKQAPVVLDLQLLSHSDKLDFNKLQETIRHNHLIPIAVRYAPTHLQKLAINAGFPILRDKDIERPTKKAPNKNPTTSRQPKKSLNNVTPLPLQKKSNTQPDSNQPSTQATHLIKDPIRSGQQIYANGTDLIVTSTVSQGAEILADGHIHIYGPLRGRALAGISGDIKAQIFCSSLEAELVSVAGQYKVYEDFEKRYWKKPVRIHLEGEHLQISKL